MGNETFTSFWVNEKTKELDRRRKGWTEKLSQREERVRKREIYEDCLLEH